MKHVIPIFEKRNTIKDKLITGKVKIFKNGKFIDEKNNVVVYTGRKFAAQKTFDLYQGADVNLTTCKITHFAIGSGGTQTNDLASVIGPLDTDTTLYRAISLNTNDTNNYLPLVDKEGNNVSGALKKITLDGSIEFIKDDITNEYTTVKCTLIIDPKVDSSLPKVYLVSEVGLFFTDGKENKGMFAHVCFPGKYMTQTDVLKIEWFFLF